MTPQKITYTDKVDKTTSLTPAHQKISAADLNEIKTSVNESIDAVEELNTDPYVYVDTTFTGTSDGTHISPYKTLQDAVDNAPSGAGIHLIDSEITLTAEVLIDKTKGFTLQGIAENTVIKYASYVSTNGKLFNQPDTGCTATYIFKNIEFANAGDYALYIRSATKVAVEYCKGYNNGWSGNRLSTTAAQTDTWANGGTLGFDSTQADLASFYASTEASNGGVMRIRDTAIVSIAECEFYNNLRGLRIQDCGAGGFGFIARNQCYNNIESGIYLASGNYNATSGCENFTVYNNASSYNSNNGILAIGGINNTIALNKVTGNWNAGCMAWHCSNTRMRDMDLSDNNRSAYNGIGNNGDALGTIQVSGGTIKAEADFIVDILDTQVYSTGLGSNVVRCGMIISSDVSDIGDRAKSLINVDDVGFKSQDYALDVLCDLDQVRLTLGDCRYIDTQIQNVRIQGSGSYYELPFSNHHTSAQTLDFQIDDTGSLVAVRESPFGPVINYYNINSLHAVGFGTDVRIILKDSNKIQFDDVPVSGISIDGTLVNSVLAQALVQLNGLFTNTESFISAGDPVVDYTFTGGNTLTIILQSGQSYSVDVSTLAVDTDTFVSSGELVGSDLILTMNDASTVTIDATNMVNGSSLPAISNNWFIAYGPSAGTQITTPTFVTSTQHDWPFYNGEELEQGHEFIWQHDRSGTIHLGLWAGSTTAATGTNSHQSVNWSLKYRIEGSPAGGGRDRVTNVVDATVNSHSVGCDIDTRYPTNGYPIDANTMFMVRYGVDGYVYLYDITDDPILIAKSNTQPLTSTILFHVVGQTIAKIPVFTERTDTWTIVHDFDDSEDGEWRDGLENHTVIKSNIFISPGQKVLLDLDGNGRSHTYGLDYTGAATGNSNAEDQLVSRFTYNTSEQIKNSSGDWSFNESSPRWSAGNGWSQGNGVPAGMLSIRYYTNNSVELWSEDFNELIMTKNVDLDGTPFYLHFGASEALGAGGIPVISKQDLVQGSQPVHSLAPQLSDQTFDIQKEQPFNVQIVLDDDTNIVNQWSAVLNAGNNWASLNQATGVFTGTAPTALGATVYEVTAANVQGGSVTADITLNVVDPVYVNLKSLRGDINKYLSGNPTNIADLARTGNGSGASDAWSIFMRVKHAGDTQTLFWYGGDGTAGNGYIQIIMQNSENIKIRYGDASDYIMLRTSSNNFPIGSWSSLMIVYKGGLTGNTPANIQDYYDEFDIYINGVLETPITSNGNNGYTGDITQDLFYVGRSSTGDYLRGALLNQFAVFDSDQSANAATIHNANVAEDLTTLATPPVHYWEPEDSVVTISDIVGSADLSGFNFSSSDLINDVPN